MSFPFLKRRVIQLVVHFFILAKDKVAIQGYQV